MKALKSHYEPVTLVIAERFNIHRRCQQQGEHLVADFAAYLKLLGAKCDFGAYLDDALRDRLVCGQGSEAIQIKLLTEARLMYARALEIALSNKTANVRERQLQNSGSAGLSVKFVQKRKEKGHLEACFCCGKANHTRDKCKFRGYTCHNCGNIGHLQQVCVKMTLKNKKVTLKL